MDTFAEKPAIITVGVSPAWDVTCCVSGLDWGDHKKLDSQTTVSAGKALNISRALDWIGISSIAAGLWGQADCAAMQQQLSATRIDVRMTSVPGSTRQNITVIDAANKKEMHMRASSGLATKQSLAQLAADLKMFIRPNCTIVFSGSLPEDELFNDTLAVIQTAVEHNAKIVLDTSGTAIKSISDHVHIHLIKPNLEELNELVGRPVSDTPDDILAAACPLCDRIDIIVVSRGEQGALLITKDTTFSCRHTEDRPAINTVGCGDFLLAGILAHLPESDLQQVLAAGVRAAAARTWGLTSTPWSHINQTIPVHLERL